MPSISQPIDIILQYNIILRNFYSLSRKEKLQSNIANESSIYNKNDKGPKFNPWGTHGVAINKSNLNQLSWTISWTKFSRKSNALFLLLKLSHEFFSKTRHGTPTCLSDSNVNGVYWIIVGRLLKVDRYSNNWFKNKKSKCKYVDIAFKNMKKQQNLLWKIDHRHLV